MLLKKHSFEFDDFFLDTQEKVLLRGGKPISITPKAFQVLLVLVENHGHLVEKTALMQIVWEDCFVEEGNVAFTVWNLRKILDDDKNNPRFIETVPKRGYRFIANVRHIESEKTAAAKSFAAPESNDPDNLSALSAGHESNSNSAASLSSFHNETNTNEFEKTASGNTAQTISAANRRLLFGRGVEIDALKKLLRRGGDARLITLTGVGGSGKTSLARVIAESCRTDFPDGIFFVELASISNPELVAAAIAQSLDVKESGDKPLLATLQTFLRERRMLLILDNFEQIIFAAPLLAELLAAAGQIKILVTSRALLRLSIETELIVPPLAVPPANNSAFSLAASENYPSVQMFVERAQKAKANFILSDKNIADISEICTKLDGLPLAIELAAARTRLLKPAAILQRLENRLQILTSRAADLPARQRTMRDTIAWSYELLTESEKILFARLAVFAGGFEAEAAEAVCAETFGGTKTFGGTEILDGLESLLGNNLLQQTEDDNGEIRLSMLATIREYALEKLAENEEEANRTRRHHAGFFLKYAKNLERETVGSEQVALLGQMETERDNFRAAMDWNSRTDGENELKLAAALAPLWTFRGYLSEGIERLGAALEKNTDAPPAVQAKALTWLGQLIWVKGDYVKAISLCEKGLAISRQIDYPIISALALFVLGMSHWYKFSDGDKSIAYLEESLSLYRQVGFDSGIVFALVVLAAIYQSQNELDEAEKLLNESLSIARQTGNHLALSIAMINCGRLEIAKGNIARAKNLCRESLRLRGEISDRWGLVQCLEPLAAVALQENAPRRAAQMLGAIDVLLESLGASPPLILRADHEPNIAAVRAALDDRTFTELFNKGRKMAAKEIIELALDEPLMPPRSFESIETGDSLSNEMPPRLSNSGFDRDSSAPSENYFTPQTSTAPVIIVLAVIILSLLIAAGFMWY